LFRATIDWKAMTYRKMESKNTFHRARMWLRKYPLGFHLIRSCALVGTGRISEAYRYYVKRTGIFTDRGELPMASLCEADLVRGVVNALAIKSVLDIGCGTGATCMGFTDLGVDWSGVEGSSLAIGCAPDQVRARITEWNLETPYRARRKADLVWCYEVIEHIHPRFEEVIVGTLAENADCCLLSAAHPGQGGSGHFNEQPIAYWITRFERHGHRYLPEITERLRERTQLFPENLAVFGKG
jgi:hypothetical protein